MKKSFDNGFTLIELCVILGIIAILASFASFNLFHAINSSTLDSSTSLLVSDIKNQQIKMMGGNVISSPTTIPFGIHFLSSQYILFHSSTYSNGDPNNLAVNLENGVQFSSVNLPSSELIFASSSGEIQNFNPAQNSITITNVNTGAQKVITLNKYGVIVSIN